MRGLPGAFLAAALLGMLLPGCFGRPPSDAVEGPSSSSASLGTAYVDQGCENALLLLLVDYARTDTYLPPGFHPRDPKEFVGSPVAFGQAAVLFIVVHCPSPQGDLTSASIDIFVESPEVPGVPEARFDLYEIARYSNGTDFGGVLAKADWPVIQGNASVTVQASSVVPVHGTRSVDASASDAEGLAAHFFGGAGNASSGPLAATSLGPSLIHFWHDGSRGLAYYAYDTTLDPYVGSGVCTVRQGTPLAAFTGPVTGSAVLGEDLGCLGISAQDALTQGPREGSPVVITFPDLVLNATAVYLSGVHAG